MTYLVEYNNKIIGTYNNYYLAETIILSCLQNKFIQDSALIHHYRKNSCFIYKSYTITLNSNNTILKKEVINSQITPLNKDVNNSQITPLKKDVNNSQITPLNKEVINSQITPLKKEVINSQITPLNKEVINSQITPLKKDVNNSQITPLNTNEENSNKLLIFTNQSAELQRSINMLKIKKEKIDESKQVYESDLKLFKIFKSSADTDNNFKIPELFAKKYEIMNNLFIEDKLSWDNFIKVYKIENYYGDYFSPNGYEEKFINNSDNNTCNIDEEINIVI
jgi:hypothetical protein